jgi:putative alpha-1,2-mannosidase
MGGEKNYISQLDQFFAEDNYNHANQPDLQVPGMYNASTQPWKSQNCNVILDSVIQSYLTTTVRELIHIGRIIKNEPQAYVRDDDSGTMSSWFVLRSMGLSPANVGDPIYYAAPILERLVYNWRIRKHLLSKLRTTIKTILCTISNA